MNTCNFCNKNFSSSSNLTRHKKICKVKKDYELEKQKQELEKEKEKNRIIELEKDKILEKDRIIKLEKDKILEKDRMLQEKDEEIAFLRTLLEACVKKPNIQTTQTIQTQNIQNNIQNISGNQLILQLDPIDFSEIKDNLHNFDLNKQKNGMTGFAEFLCKDVFNKKIILTDSSRDIFRYNTTEKKDVRDPKGIFLLNESIRQDTEQLLSTLVKTREFLEECDESQDKIDKTTRAIKLIRKSKENISVHDTDFSNVVKAHALDNMNQNLFLQE